MARCLCEDCIGTNGQMQCELVYYKVPVLKMVGQSCDENGFYNFQDNWEELPVGCTCAKPRTSTSRGATETGTSTSRSATETEQDPTPPPK